jgi:hypothetical protein
LPAELCLASDREASSLVIKLGDGGAGSAAALRIPTDSPSCRRRAAPGGFGLADDRVHSPNEEFELRCFERGILTHAALLAEFAAL